MQFAEKSDSIVKNASPKMPRLTNSSETNCPYVTVSTMNDLTGIIGTWDNISLTGCSDVYLLSEIMYALQKVDKTFDIDKRYLFHIPT